MRFPPILRIATEPPTDSRSRSADVSRIGPKEELGVVAMIPTLRETPARVQKAPSIFRFRSSDERTTVSLALDFYALSTTAYTHWADFWEELLRVRAAVETVYAPAKATRLGLRYINQFTLGNTGLRSAQALPSVLRSELVTLLAEQPWDTPLESVNQIIAEGQCESERITLRVGFKRQEPEPLLLLDLDYYVDEGATLEQLHPFYERAHDVIYRAFRWSIRDGGLDLFGPSLTEGV